MINQEEYEVLRNYYLRGIRWISRNKNGNLVVSKIKPDKYEKKWLPRCPDEDWSELRNSETYLFLFIQWDDEESYRIADLIKEYEKKKYRFRLGDLEISDFVDNSSGKSYTVFSLVVEEDEEVKKDKEWLKEELVQSYLKESETYLDGKEFQKARYFEISEKKLFNLIDQLDQPKVKQLERKIKELESFNDELIRDNNQLRNELDNQEVLSQVLPVVPKFVADWMEENSTGRYSWWKKIAEWESGVPAKDRKVYDWYAQCNEDTFVIAWITSHYEIEEEPKYCVVLPKITGSDELCLVKDDDSEELWFDGDLEYLKKRAEGITYQFTEQEIKDYDERFWAFAVPVEGEEDER